MKVHFQMLRSMYLGKRTFTESVPSILEEGASFTDDRLQMGKKFFLQLNCMQSYNIHVVQTQCKCNNKNRIELAYTNPCIDILWIYVHYNQPFMLYYIHE